MTPEELVKAMAERNADLAKRPRAPIQPPDSRPLGLVFCAAGLMGIGYSALTIISALDHDPHIYFSWKSLLISTPAFLVGLRWVALGRAAPEALDTSYRLSRSAKIYYMVCVLTAPISAYAYLHVMKSLGYQ